MTVQATNQGSGFGVGVLASNIEVQAGFNMPLRKTNVPHIMYVRGGYQIDLNDFSVTPSIGIADYKVKDFSDWDKGGSVISINKTLPIFSVEAGKDMNIGRLFISANYCQNIFFGIGIKGFFK